LAFGSGRLATGPEVAAPEQAEGDGSAALTPARPEGGRGGSRALADAEVAGVDWRPFGEDPHVQLSAVARHRSSDRVHDARPGGRDGREDRRADGRAAPRGYRGAAGGRWRL